MKIFRKWPTQKAVTLLTWIETKVLILLLESKLDLHFSEKL